MNDMTGIGRELLEQGIAAVTICQEPEKQGAMSLDILTEYLLFGTMPADKWCHTKLSIHIAQNIE